MVILILHVLPVRCRVVLTRVTRGSGGLMSCLQPWDPACCKPARWGCSCPAHSLPPCLGVLEVRRRTWGFSGLLTPGRGQGRWRQDMHTDQPRKSLPRTASSADSNQANSCHPPDASRILVSQSPPRQRVGSLGALEVCVCIGQEAMIFI